MTASEHARATERFCKHLLTSLSRTRRVKCDEMRSFCNKCIRSGRQCDGYPHQKGTGEIALPIAPGGMFMAQRHTENTNKIVEGGHNESSHTTDSSSFKGTSGPLKQDSTHNTLGRRQRGEEDDDRGQNNEDRRDPKRPRALLSPPQSTDDSTKFGCPYRKRDPRKYNVQCWRSCALTPLESVARVKYTTSDHFIRSLANIEQRSFIQASSYISLSTMQSAVQRSRCSNSTSLATRSLQVERYHPRRWYHN